MSIQYGLLNPAEARGSSFVKNETNRYIHSVVGKELLVGNATEFRVRDSVRSRPNKSLKVAETMIGVDLARIRHQIDTMPDGLREQLRLSYAKKCDQNRQNLQDSQTIQMGKFEKFIQKRWEELGIDYTKFQIGGHEKGLFELMYRIEPSPLMSKSQFIAVMRRFLCMDFDGPIVSFLTQLFGSFDLNESDSIDWRMFLCFMLRVFQPVSDLVIY